MIHVGRDTFSLQVLLGFWSKTVGSKIGGLSRESGLLLLQAWWCGSFSTKHMSHINSISILRKAFAKQGPRPPALIWTALSVALDRRATLTHDKLYSILGLLPERLRCTADYTISLPELCSLVTGLLIIGNQHAAWLDVASGTNTRGCPSWALDISRSNDKMSRFMTAHHYTASGSHTSPLRMAANIKALSLRVQGLRVTTVSSRMIGGLKHYRDSSLSGDVKMLSIFRHLQAFASMHGLNGNSTQFWRTLIRDTGPTRYRGQEESKPPLQAEWLDTLISWWELYSQDCIIQVMPGENVNLRDRWRVFWQPEKNRDPTNVSWGSSPPKQLLSLAEVMKFIGKITWSMNEASLFFTEQGHSGVCTPDIEPGDEIFIINGIGVPIVAPKCKDRPTNAGASYQYVSDCYLDGWMYGDTINESTPWEEIVFV